MDNQFIDEKELYEQAKLENIASIERQKKSDETLKDIFFNRFIEINNLTDYMKQESSAYIVKHIWSLCYQQQNAAIEETRELYQSKLRKYAKMAETVISSQLSSIKRQQGELLDEVFYAVTESPCHSTEQSAKMTTTDGQQTE
jgi:hypothetical protein